MTDIGLELKHARENKELTQEAVMRITGINRKSLSGYENNVAEPDLMTFATLARLYNISADQILGIHSNPAEQIPTYAELCLLKKIRKLDKQHIIELNALLDVLVRYSKAD